MYPLYKSHSKIKIHEMLTSTVLSSFNDIAFYNERLKKRICSPKGDCPERRLRCFSLNLNSFSSKKKLLESGEKLFCPKEKELKTTKLGFLYQESKSLETNEVWNLKEKYMLPKLERNRFCNFKKNKYVLKSNIEKYNQRKKIGHGEKTQKKLRKINLDNLRNRMRESYMKVQDAHNKLTGTFNMLKGKIEKEYIIFKKNENII